MKTILKYGLVSLSLLSLGLAVTSDLPVVGVQMVSAADPATTDKTVDQLPKVNASSSPAAIKKAIATAKSFKAYWQEQEKVETAKLQAAEQRLKQLEVERDMLALKENQVEAQVLYLREMIVRLESAGRNANDPEYSAVMSQYQSLNSELVDLRQQYDVARTQLDAFRHRHEAVKALVEKAKAEASKISERIAEMTVLLPARTAVSQSPTLLSSATHPISVALGQADVGKLFSLTTVSVTRAEAFAKLPAPLTMARVSLFDIHVLDAEDNISQISAPARVTLPVNPNRRVARVIYYLPETGAVENLAFTLSTDRKSVSFTVTHFSHYGVVYEDQDTGTSTTAAPDTTTPSSPSNGSTPSPSSDAGKNTSTSPSATDSAKVADTATTTLKVLPKTSAVSSR